jgi:hypothetical protein
MGKNRDYSKPMVMTSGWEFCVNCEEYSYVNIIQDVWEYEGVLVPTVYHQCQDCGGEFYVYSEGQYDELLGLYMVRDRLKNENNI